ncbi:IBR domain [Geosmithia morbida]|uniref:IBR domain n=1 Tax=Geosmithia morbida TaxID=1094350 RepID=A0A9P4Z3G5_9HYPO|nr:IBR domain [Geosmithia morbida]KAF4126821.1 IBR domain [Geosmithia morbida]
MVFSGLLTTGDSNKPSGNRPRAKTSSSSATSDLLPLPGFIHDESQLPCLPPERPNLRELNESLEALAAAFPDIQIEVFRELLSSFDGESRLALVADALLKNRVTWVKGRWKVADRTADGRGGLDLSSNNHNDDYDDDDDDDDDGRNEEDGDKGDKDGGRHGHGHGHGHGHATPAETVPRNERFRSSEYVQAVQTLGYQEFKGLSKSTINAVLAESNYSYLEARPTLVTLSSKSWRFAISAFLLRRKPVTGGDAVESHPLVTWRSSGQGSIYPALRATGNAELDRELFTRLIAPIRAKERAERDEKDSQLAAELNLDEAEAAEATHECACCFMAGTFEQFTHCNREGHMICFRCVRHSVNEAVFGQGWQSSIDHATGTLRCMAVDGSGCEGGRISRSHMRRAMRGEKKGGEILRRLDQRLAEHSLAATRLPLVRCPFCSYAEVDDVYMPLREQRMRVRVDSVINLVLVVLCVGVTPFLLPLVVLSSLLCLVVSSQQTLGHYLRAEWRSALGRRRRHRRGQRFVCQSPDCRRASCLSCGKSWVDVHVCHESSLMALRTQVEQAMSMAVKRVCPRCSTSFVKNSGCNKLTCPCGYKMCYVCRADLTDQGYRHFCDHFRPDGDPRPCADCDRCNLWESEDTDKVLREAREDAERRWKAAEARELSGADKAFLETGVASDDAGHGLVESVLLRGKLPTLSQVLDVVVDVIFV